MNCFVFSNLEDISSTFLLWFDNTHRIFKLHLFNVFFSHFSVKYFLICIILNTIITITIYTDFLNLNLKFYCCICANENRIYKNAQFCFSQLTIIVENLWEIYLICYPSVIVSNINLICIIVFFVEWNSFCWRNNPTRIHRIYFSKTILRKPVVVTNFMCTSCSSKLQALHHCVINGTLSGYLFPSIHLQLLWRQILICRKKNTANINIYKCCRKLMFSL